MSENCRKSTLQFPRAQAHVFKKLVLSDKQSKPQDIQIAAIEDLRKTIKSKSIQNQWIFGTFAFKNYKLRYVCFKDDQLSRLKSFNTFTLLFCLQLSYLVGQCPNCCLIV